MSSEQLGGRNTTVKETWVGGKRERGRERVIWRTVDLGKRLVGENVRDIYLFF